MNYFIYAAAYVRSLSNRLDGVRQINYSVELQKETELNYYHPKYVVVILENNFVETGWPRS